MKRRSIRSFQKSSSSKENAFFKKETKKESAFFSAPVFKSFFRPAPIQRKCEKCEEDDKKVHRMTDQKEEERKLQRQPDKKEDEKNCNERRVIHLQIH